jgi:hypothetical protein
MITRKVSHSERRVRTLLSLCFTLGAPAEEAGVHRSGRIVAVSVRAEFGIAAQLSICSTCLVAKMPIKAIAHVFALHFLEELWELLKGFGLTSRCK